MLKLLDDFVGHYTVDKVYRTKHSVFPEIINHYLTSTYPIEAWRFTYHTSIEVNRGGTYCLYDILVHPNDSVKDAVGRDDEIIPYLIGKGYLDHITNNLELVTFIQYLGELRSSEYYRLQERTLRTLYHRIKDLLPKQRDDGIIDIQYSNFVTELIMNHNFVAVYDEWLGSDIESGLSLSIVRRDIKNPFSFDNMVFGHRKDTKDTIHNRELVEYDRRNGVNVYEVRNGNVLMVTHKSVSVAMEVYGLTRVMINRYILNQTTLPNGNHLTLDKI